MCAVAAFGGAFFSTSGDAQTLPAEQAPAESAPLITAWRFTPEITVTESHTDNAALLPSATAKQSWVTESTPSIRIEKTGVRSRFYLDYRLSHFRYANDSQLTTASAS